MPRPPRIELENGLFHVTARGNAGRAIYADDHDRQRFLLLLGAAIRGYAWRCLSYCALTTHFHLLLQTPEPTLSRGMQWFGSRYARYFNDRHGTFGHVFQGRFGAKLVQTDQHMWATARYIARNPVDAGICPEPRDYRWSSHAAVIRGAPPSWLDHGALLGYFRSSGPDPESAYRAYVEGSDPLRGGGGMRERGLTP